VSTRPQRGDVWQVDFGRPTGNEQGAGLRPAVVISTDEFNNSGAGLAIVAPLTTAQRGYPSRVRVRPGASGLRAASWAAVEHLRSVSILRLREYRGGVDRSVVDQIERVISFLFSDRPDGATDPERA
jgi:mRNA interferase MazF